MKKLIISLLLINLFVNSVCAETYDGSCSISLSYNYLPSYSVKIPKNLNITNNTTDFDYYVKGNIYFDSCLKVLFDEESTISSNNKNMKIYITQNKTLWNYNELSNSYTKYSASISHDTLKAGTWHGELNVVISLTGGKQ